MKNLRKILGGKQLRCIMGDLNLLPATSSKLQKFEKTKKREY